MMIWLKTSCFVALRFLNQRGPHLAAKQTRPVSRLPAAIRKFLPKAEGKHDNPELNI
jgi:hypothetical protein